jgi:nucleotide-binding universal stress UspA family protein
MELNMPINDMVVLLGGEGDVAGPYALSLAQEMSASVLGASVTVQASLPGFAMAAMPYDTMASALEHAELLAAQVLRRFGEAAADQGIEHEELAISAPRDEVEWRIAAIARHFDLAIVRQSPPTDSIVGHAIIEALLFGSGRPIVVVPDIHQARRAIKAAVVAWDGSRAAARALADALPLLQRAGSVDVVTVSAGGSDEPSLDRVRLAAHLARHGIRSQHREVAGSAGYVADALLSYVADASADLLVMGAYGHSRFP